jgi:hypothetical protein
MTRAVFGGALVDRDLLELDPADPGAASGGGDLDRAGAWSFEELATKLTQPHVLALVTGQDPQSAKEVENLLFDPG